jgi:hypothetical protein
MDLEEEGRGLFDGTILHSPVEAFWLNYEN